MVREGCNIRSCTASNRITEPAYQNENLERFRNTGPQIDWRANGRAAGWLNKAEIKSCRTALVFQENHDEITTASRWYHGPVRKFSSRSTRFRPWITAIPGDFGMLVPMKVDYGVRTLVYLAQQDNSAFTPTSDIAGDQHIPVPYLLRICSELHKSGLIESRRGPQGGHKLGKASDSISVRDVVDSVDYTLAPIDCVEEPESCRLSGACSQRELWSDVEAMLLEHLSKVTIGELASQQILMVAAAPVHTNF